MPRKARLDIPGLLQHVIARGIERRKIFIDDKDRSLFIDRLSKLLEETETDCFAWSLIPNHFHLLLRPNRFELKLFMRRLLTGYAINFNCRHKRAGHVFQNRYKSIVCEEETYLLELVRYIHLNPLRAKLVADLKELDDYSWCGHSVLMGNKEMEGQRINEVMIRFGKIISKARRNYLDFMQDGIAQGKREDLVGGGLKRSLMSQIKTMSDIEIFDERVLGSGDFVEQLRREQDLQEQLITGMLLPELIVRVAKFYGIEMERIRWRSKDRNVMTARDVFCYIAVRILHHAGTHVGLFLNIKRSAVSHAVRRGEEVIANQIKLVEEITTKIH
jgi:REP element-mobilizing transposase RayT